jgi:hypothetical protein
MAKGPCLVFGFYEVGLAVPFHATVPGSGLGSVAMVTLEWRVGILVCETSSAQYRSHGSIRGHRAQDGRMVGRATVPPYSPRDGVLTRGLGIVQ